MRSYIFTKREVQRLLIWLETGEEDAATRMLFSHIRRNYPTLRDDIHLFILALKKLRAMGRGDRRPRMEEYLGSEVAKKARALKTRIEADKGRNI